MRRLLAVVLLVLATVSPAFAETPLSGAFTATRACPALKSLRKGTNPGNVMLTPGTAYGVIAADTEPAENYYITVPGANPVKRWVAVNCGTFAGADTANTDTAPVSTQPDAPASGTTRYILAVSWEPAFCEGRPKVSECRSQTGASPSARQFSLHGLWPQPRSNSYCGVSASDRATDNANRWRDLPEVRLSAPTRTALEAVMPGTQSALERHEWIVHGTCYGTPQERYFSDAIAAIGAVNASPVATLFAANVGRRLTLDQVRSAFDTAFGRGAGERIRLACDDDNGRRLISEITIGLSDKVATAAALAASVRNAAPTDGGCDGGIVDPAGLQ